MRYSSIDHCLDLIPNEATLVSSMAAAEPRGLYEALGDLSFEGRRLNVWCANPSKKYRCFERSEVSGSLTFHLMFLTAVLRNYQGHNLIYYAPQHLSEWSKNLIKRRRIDVFWGVCTPPDNRGFVSLGPSCCYESEILRAADLVVLEINKKLPVTYGSTYIPVDWVTRFVEPTEWDLPTVDRSKVGEADQKIAGFIEGLIPDRATIQLGIGSIPNAIGMALRCKKDLGIHTEMINDTMMELYQIGVVTGRYKTLWPGKMVGAFAYGSKELYDFIDGNPGIELEPASVVNDPYRIGRNHRMFSINTAVEIDITGQVCSESLGHMELSGVGGAADTHVGAKRSEGGRGIIAMHSTTKDGSSSKIVFELRQGAKVSISRNDIDTVVTEFGVAELCGRSVAERVKSLISIAHPKFREDLERKAISFNYL